MPELKAAQAQLWEDWVAKLTEMVGELQGAGCRARRARPVRARAAVELGHRRARRAPTRQPRDRAATRARPRPALRRLPPVAAFDAAQQVGTAPVGCKSACKPTCQSICKTTHRPTGHPDSQRADSPAIRLVRQPVRADNCRAARLTRAAHRRSRCSRASGDRAGFRRPLP